MAASLVERLAALGLSPEETTKVATTAMAQATRHVLHGGQAGIEVAAKDGEGPRDGRPRVVASPEEQVRRRAQRRGRWLKDDPLLVLLYNDIGRLSTALEQTVTQPLRPRQPRRDWSGVVAAVRQVVGRREEIRRYALKAAKEATQVASDGVVGSDRA